MTMSKQVPINRKAERGVALIVVLGLIMAITVLSLGYLAQSETQMAYGENMALRAQMDQMAASGLEHARGLLLYPQEIGSLDGWSATAQQLDDTSADYYDVNVAADASDACNYAITCQAYRLEDGNEVGRSGLTSALRLDPSVALWTGSDFVVRDNWTVYGDIYTAGDISNVASSNALNGDVFAGGGIAGLNPTGRQTSSATAPVPWPFDANSPADIKNSFCSNYTSNMIFPGIPLTMSLGPFDPPRVFYCTGDLEVGSNVTIGGMLLVTGDLTFAGSNITLDAGQGQPALYVGGNLSFRGASNVQINGVATVQGKVLVGADTSSLQIVGGLLAADEIVETATDTSGYDSDAMVRSTPVWSSGAVVLDGTSDYLQTVDNSTTLQLTDTYTLVLQVKANATQNTWAGLLCKTDADGTTNHWVLQFDVGGTNLIVKHGEYSWDTGITAADLADGFWHQVAVVRQGTTMTSYLDGSVSRSGTFSQSPGQGLGHLNIGGDRTATASHLYTGTLDDIRVYNRSLNAGEVAALPSDNSLIGYWSFSESGASVEIKAAPVESALIVYKSDGSSGWVPEYWSQAGGAFFKEVHREAY